MNLGSKVKLSNFFIQFCLACIQMISPVHVVGGIRVEFKHVRCTISLPTVAFPCDSIERTGWHLKHRKVHENEVISYSHTLCQPRARLSFLGKNCFVSKELDVYIQYLDKPGRCLHLRPIDQQKLSKAQGKIMFFLIEKVIRYEFKWFLLISFF